MPRNTAQRPLASLLAHSLTANDLFPLLHQHALDVTGGACSLLLQHNPRTGSLQATSAFGLDTPRAPAPPRARGRAGPPPWRPPRGLPARGKSPVVSEAFARRAPALLADAA